MYISKLKIKNFRNFNELEIDLHEGINVIVGPNNVGKSNLINIVNFLHIDPNSMASIDDFNKYYLHNNLEQIRTEPPVIEIEYTIEHDIDFDIEDSAFSKISNISLSFFSI